MIPIHLKQLQIADRIAYEDLVRAKQQHKHHRGRLLAALETCPPRTFRLQEAYQNPDGTYDKPHWDEVSPFEGQSLIDGGELLQHILHEGEWTAVYENPEDDPRPGCRRVIEVTW